jgi:hypothetical protein
MSNCKILIIICFLVSCKSPDSANMNNFDKTCVPIIESFFQKVSSKNYNTAINELLSANENIDLKDSATIALKSKFSVINQVSGVYRGNSLIKKRSINEDIAIYSYLAKYDKKFYRFIFEFYNNGVQTKIYKFLFDDSAEFELEESLKLYMQ